ncbi:MAG TPA: hypothetical protein VIM12_00715 [Noviherbaspirillum sp.]|jgi:hypothetical protein|uniref:hypothetical protein n=1 Tax=Noviherbaspirillum sp. TaxID=1926288 RepID=UPI002F935167
MRSNINVSAFLQQIVNFVPPIEDTRVDNSMMANEVYRILADLDRINGGGTALFSTNKEHHRSALLERARQNDGVISPRERELIGKAVDGTISVEERDELINLLPAFSARYEPAGPVRQKSDSELLHEMEDIEEAGAGFMEQHDFLAIQELRRRASLDGGMSPELNARFHKLIAGTELNAEEYKRFCELLQQEDNIG